MPRSDADGVDHVTGSDEITEAGLDHIKSCPSCLSEWRHILYALRRI